MTSLLKSTTNTDAASEQPPSFKQQLDKEAETIQTQDDEPSTMKAIVDKVTESVTEYLPAGVPVSTGSNPDGTIEGGGNSATATPRRPEHDDKIEEFVREQHRSNKGVGTLASAKQ